MYSARSSKDVLITSNSNNNKLGTDNPRLARRRGKGVYPTPQYLRDACLPTHTHSRTIALTYPDYSSIGFTLRSIIISQFTRLNCGTGILGATHRVPSLTQYLMDCVGSTLYMVKYGLHVQRTLHTTHEHPGTHTHTYTHLGLPTR